MHYHHWPEGFYFRKGEPVTLAMDIGEIQDAANEIDRRPGYRDLGNGWLLNHPLQKLMNYQYYLHHSKAQASGGFLDFTWYTKVSARNLHQVQP